MARPAAQKPDAKAQKWADEIEAAGKREKEWRTEAQKVVDLYRGTDAKRNSFNILWANTEVLRPSLYSNPPKPDVRRRFRDAYGASAWEWCLAHHRRDADFPRACARGLWADPRLPTAKPYQGRHKALTAPEEVLEGVEEAFGDLLGADRSEDVRPAPTPLLPHPNRFEYGAQAVPDGSVQGAGPAPWERIKVCSAGDTQPAVWCGVRAGWACSWASRG